MKAKFILICMFLALYSGISTAQEAAQSKKINETINAIQALKDTLNSLSERSDNEFFKMHCNSMIQVIESKTSLSKQDTSFLTGTYNAFNNSTIEGNGKLLDSYLERKRSFIIAWISPTDGNVSFSWLKVPKDWDPEIEYPLYIELHGLWSVANNPIEYLTYPYLNGASSSFAWEDGYLLSPWGRGNLWYQGISETDIWECIDALEAIANIDLKRKYLCGHSMGGYGAWSIGSKWPETWAALGIHAGALWYDNSSLVTNQVVNKLKDVPTYFVCGTQDGLLSINQTAYSMLQGAGNTDIVFVTFPGAHDYIQSNVENMYRWMREFTNDDLNRINEPFGSVKEYLSVYPNPVFSGTQIRYSLNSACLTRLELLNQNGQVVEVMVNGYMDSGNHIENWTRKASIPAGLYYIRLLSGTQSETQKILVGEE